MGIRSYLSQRDKPRDAGQHVRPDRRVERFVFVYFFRSQPVAEAHSSHFAALSIALAQNSEAPLDGRTFDRFEIPVYTQSRRSAGNCMALVYLHPIGGDVVELRNIFEPPRVGNGAAQRDMQLHEEMRADADVERLGQMRGLQPWGYAPDARDVDLNDRTGPPLQIVAELRRTIEAFADRNRNRRGARKPLMALDVVRWQRLLEPADVCGFIKSRAANRLLDRESLIGVGEDLEVRPDRSPQRRQPGDVLAGGPADLDLRSAETLRLRLQRIGDERIGRQMQPAALRRIELHLFACAACHHMQ